MAELLLTCATNYTAMFGQMLEEGSFSDCTLAAGGNYLRAHKAVLAAASVYFELLFTQDDEKDPVIIFTNIRYKELEAVTKFIYQGEVMIFEDELGEFLNVAKFLQIRGCDHNNLIVRERHAPTCEPEESLMTFERSSTQQASSVCEKVEGEDTTYDDEFADIKDTTRPYVSWEDSSQILPAIDGGSIVSSMPPDENVCKSELPDFESSFPYSSVEPAFEHEFSTLVSDIDIKEQDEYCSEVEKDANDTTARMEDVNGDSEKEVSHGQHDAELRLEDTDVQCGSAVVHVEDEERFKCPSCYFETTEESVFSEHIRSHILDIPFQLPLCTLSSVQSSTTNNGEIENLKEKSLKCTRTKAVEKESASRTCKEKPFKCTQCSYACSLKRNLITHIRTHTGEKPFKCSQCSYVCSRKYDLKSHMHTHTGEKPFKCSECSYVCSRKSDLKSHMHTHTGEKPFKCSLCTFACSKKTNLPKHMRKHTGEKPFKCSQCSFACSWKHNLITHIRKHTGEKPFTCPKCTYACNQKASLIKHMYAHTGEKPFKCSQCSFACSQNTNLLKHMRKHTGEKPFKCTKCTYASIEKGSLVNHMRTHTGEKPFTCTKCSYACSVKHHLITHMRKHTGEKPFACTKCTYACAQKGSLRKHMRTHTGEKPFKCMQCTYACSQNYELKHHMYRHTGEKPFKCSQCSFACSRKPSLIRHVRKHIGEK